MNKIDEINSNISSSNIISKDLNRSGIFFKRGVSNGNINVYNPLEFFSKDLPSNREENSDKKNFNIIVADDDLFPRQSTIRVINKLSEELNISINIIEAEDGADTIYTYYKSAVHGIVIHLILSDENMDFINGSKSAEIISQIQVRKKMNLVPFYLVTSYTQDIFDKKIYEYVKERLSKPLSKERTKKLILDLLC